jgi:hypothetical protein
MSKQFHSALFTPAPEESLSVQKKQKTEQTMKCIARVAKIALHENFPGINNEGQALPPHDPHYDDYDYSHIKEGVLTFLRKANARSVKEGTEPVEVLKLFIRLQVTNMGTKILPMICGEIILHSILYIKLYTNFLIIYRYRRGKDSIFSTESIPIHRLLVGGFDAQRHGGKS